METILRRAKEQNGNIYYESSIPGPIIRKPLKLSIRPKKTNLFSGSFAELVKARSDNRSGSHYGKWGTDSIPVGDTIFL